MQTCYLILSHVDVPHVLALVRRIRELSPDCVVLVRHDQTNEPVTVDEVESAGGFLVQSGISVQWGNWSLVQATLEALSQASRKFDPDLTVLISGQDWPARPLQVWEAENVAYDAILSARVVRPRKRFRRDAERKLADRYDYAWRPLDPFWRRFPRAVRSTGAALWFRTVERFRSPVLLNKLPRDLGWTIGIRTRRLRSHRPMHKGEQWCALSRASVDALLRYEKENPTLFSAFQRMMIPDETFIQTVVLNDTSLKTRNASVSWHRFASAFASHPRAVTPDDIEEVWASGAPFARKIGSMNADVRNGLDARIDEDRRWKALP